jgi:large subunit ribosomal protein L22
MQFKASHRYAPVTARKARPVVDMVRGLPVNDALEALSTTHRRAGYLLTKVIRSAIANAEQKQAVGANELFIETIVANEGPLKQGRLRWRPGAMGRIKPIRKRTSHLCVTLGVIDDGRSKRRAPKKTEDAGE